MFYFYEVEVPLRGYRKYFESENPLKVTNGHGHAAGANGNGTSSTNGKSNGAEAHSSDEGGPVMVTLSAAASENLRRQYYACVEECHEANEKIYKCLEEFLRHFQV